MDTLQCAVVLAKMERFEWEIEQRARLAKRYDSLLATAAPSIRPLTLRADRTSAYAQYTVLAEDRENVRTRLQAHGVPTAVHYPIPLHRQPAYESYGVGAHLANSEAIAAQVLSLPMYADMSDATQAHITRACAASLI